MNIDIKVFSENEIANWIDQIAQIRLTAFKEYPYLYSGNMAIEKKYLTAYSNAAESLFLAALYENNIIGIGTGVPLKESADVLPGGIEIFAQNKLDVANYYYFGEFIIHPEYRNKHIFSQLFKKASQIAKNRGYTHVCCMTIDQEEDHPLKPDKYKNPDEIWKKMGLKKSNLKLVQAWPTIMPDGSIVDLDHSLSFWIADL